MEDYEDDGRSKLIVSSDKCCRVPKQHREEASVLLVL